MLLLLLLMMTIMNDNDDDDDDDDDEYSSAVTEYCSARIVQFHEHDAKKSHHTLYYHMYNFIPLLAVRLYTIVGNLKQPMHHI